MQSLLPINSKPCWFATVGVPEDSGVAGAVSSLVVDDESFPLPPQEQISALATKRLNNFLIFLFFYAVH